MPGLILWLLCIAAAVSAQTAQPTATPPAGDDDGSVVKISTTLIQIDVIVTDKKGNQVTNLKPEDFEIYEDGVKQEITNFSYIFNKSTESASNADAQNSGGKISVPVPPAKLKLEQVKRTYAIVVDDLGISFENIPAIKYSLKKFINEQKQSGDLVAIVRTGSGIGALQSFTSDKRQLLAAVEKIKWNPQGRGEINAFKPYQKSFDDKEDEFERDRDKQAAQELEDRIKAGNEDFRAANYSVGSLGALSYVIRGMKELPGRKSIMFFSEGFNTYITANGRNDRIRGKRTYNRIAGVLRNVAELANRSSVVIYTFDPRGLINPLALRDDPINNEVAELNDTQQTLRNLAYDTGGIPYVDQNKLEKGLEKAIEDQNGYYLIGYQPDSETFEKEKAKFNKFRIKVNRPDLEVRYRSGFFSVPDEKVAQTTDRTPQQKIYQALTSPFGAGGISLNLNTLFANDEETGSFIRSLVNISAKDLSFSAEPNNMKKANFDVIAMTFGDNGTPVDQVAKNYTIRVSEENYRKMLEQGFVYNLLVPIKKDGAYQFRIALRDSVSGKIGSASQFIEVPDLKNKRLVLSGIVLNDFTPEQLKKSASGQTAASDSDGFSDTAVRRFKQGGVLRYDYVIYNAAQNPTKLQVQAKLFRDNQLVLEGAPSAINTSRQKDLSRIETAGAITLGRDLKPGSYILQILVKDENAKAKYSLASQIVEFEIVQ